MEGLDKGGQGPISGCCAIEEEEECDMSIFVKFRMKIQRVSCGGTLHGS
jgi:hypothetical protein